MNWLEYALPATIAFLVALLGLLARAYLALERKHKALLDEHELLESRYEALQRDSVRELRALSDRWQGQVLNALAKRLQL